MMKDRFLYTTACVERLFADYKKHNSLFVAFDFDNTIYDYHGLGDTFPRIEKLLLQCKLRGHTLILFTAREGEKLQEAIKYCDQRGFSPSYVNKNPIMETVKPYYNILLDDRAGLQSAFEILTLTLKYIENEQSFNQ